MFFEVCRGTGRHVRRPSERGGTGRRWAKSSSASLCGSGPTSPSDYRTGRCIGLNCFESHSCFLLLSGSSSAVLRAGLVELPGEVEREGAAGGVVDGEVAIAVDDGIGLVGIEDVDAAQVGSQ